MESKKQAALRYHEFPKPGKIAIQATKPFETAVDLSLAYSPGVAEPCLAIADSPADVYRYTGKGNLVAVISNGTAVLGLGDIGPLASKPVMEGKGVLFKAFADIDVFDIELDCKDVDSFVATVAAMAPTFGGINLEDIKAPECFDIEQQLRDKLDIPVFHDDQHGTAIISSAALLNALELTKRDVKEIRVVVSGAGAAALSCADLMIQLGVRRENLLMVDSKGVIYKGRTEGMNRFKEAFAADTHLRTLEEAMEESDVFFGLSAAGILKEDMLRSMNPQPIVFAMANPDPEIEYEVAKLVRPDVIMATGRSDYPNQVNNVLGFPFIFRGALDVRARGINDAMKLAAVRALAALAKEPVPESVQAAYGDTRFDFGPEYLIPKPFDARVLYTVAPAVAQAAIDSGLARQEIDINEYQLRLMSTTNEGRAMLRRFYGSARKFGGARIALPEATNPKVLRAAVMAYEESIAHPILLGVPEEIQQAAQEIDADISKLEIVNPRDDSRYQKYIESYYDVSKRDGVTITEARRNVRNEQVFASMMLANSDADGMICGVDNNFAEMVRPILENVGLRAGCTTTAGLYIVSIKGKLLFCADTAINVDMNAQKLASIALMSAEFATHMGITPHVAMLSYSSFGSVNSASSRMVRTATELVKAQNPKLEIDGEMQVDVAMNSKIQQESYGFSSLKSAANILIFPDMQSGNIAYKLLQRAAGARVVGPILLGLRAPAFVMQRHAGADEIFNMITVAAGQAAELHNGPEENSLQVNQS